MDRMSHRFAHLQLHSEYSLADATVRIKDMVGAADYNPYEGVVTKGSIRQVWLRGKPAVSSGKVLAGPDGKYLPRGKCQL